MTLNTKDNVQVTQCTSLYLLLLLSKEIPWSELKRLQTIAEMEDYFVISNLLSPTMTCLMSKELRALLLASVPAYSSLRLSQTLLWHHAMCVTTS